MEGIRASGQRALNEARCRALVDILIVTNESFQGTTRNRAREHSVGTRAGDP